MLQKQLSGQNIQKCGLAFLTLIIFPKFLFLVYIWTRLNGPNQAKFQYLFLSYIWTKVDGSNMAQNISVYFFNIYFWATYTSDGPNTAQQ